MSIEAKDWLESTIKYGEQNVEFAERLLKAIEQKNAEVKRTLYLMTFVTVINVGALIGLILKGWQP